MRIRADDNCNSHPHLTAKSHQLLSIPIKFQLVQILMTVDESFKHPVVCTFVVPDSTMSWNCFSWHDGKIHWKTQALFAHLATSFLVRAKRVVISNPQTLINRHTGAWELQKLLCTLFLENFHQSLSLFIDWGLTVSIALNTKSKSKL